MAAGCQSEAMSATERYREARDQLVALRGESGVVGHDEERGDELRAIEFPRIKGGKAFDPSVDWFTTLLADLGQA